VAENLFAFVCGLHRSGTSLLARAIADHPDASGFENSGVPEDEGQFLQSVYPPARIHGGPGRFGLNPRSHLTERSPLATAENRAKLLSEWGPHWDMEKAVLVEKSPPNLLKTGFLQALFPDAAFVAIVRHPVAASLATQKRRDTLAISSLVDHWLACHELFVADAKRLRRLIAIRYEDLVAHPELIATVQEQLGLRPPSWTVRVEPGLNERYFKGWRADEELVRRFEQRARRFGYSLAEPGRLDLDPAPDVGRLLLDWRDQASSSSTTRRPASPSP
jgi:Sulfotransferase family